MSADSFEGTRRDINRAIRRLSILEWVILAAAAVFALIGGWVSAYLLQSLGFPFRLTWTVCSILLFGAPGLRVLLSQRERSPESPEPNGGR